MCTVTIDQSEHGLKHQWAWRSSNEKVWFCLHAFRVVNLVFVCDMASTELGAKFNDWDTFDNALKR